MVKVVSSKYNAEHWSLEEETLAVTHQAGLYFSLAWRIFYAFGLTVSLLRQQGSRMCQSSSLSDACY